MLRESTLADTALILTYLRDCTAASHDAALRCLAHLHTLRIHPTPFDMIHLCDALRLNMTLHTLVIGGLDDMGLATLAALRHPVLRHLTLFQVEWTPEGQETLVDLLTDTPLLTCTVDAYTLLHASVTERLLDRLSPTIECLCLTSEWSPALHQKVEAHPCTIVLCDR